MSLAPLPRSFYARPVLVVARDLLGTHLVHAGPDGVARGGRIVEVEAYGGPDDRASHARLRRARGGLVPTERSALMFGPPGVSYIYLIYGLHHCFNAVAHEEGAVGAVLVRALEPWPALAERNCAGPARLCAALGLDRGHNGLDLCAGPPLYLADGGTPVADGDVVSGPRIGVDYAGDDALLPHRLCDRRSAALSRRIA
jgi:DNA-3-methyladenine glycosylase